jgi:Sec-independent protein translocase protein TatA
MKIELLSFVFGIIITLATVIILERVYGKIFGNKRLRELDREVGRLRRIVQKKDELIKKSLRDIKEKEIKNDEEKQIT